MTEGLRFWENGIYRLANAGLLAGVALFGGERFLGIGNMTTPLVIEALVILGLLAGINFLPLRGKFICLSAAALGVGMAVSAAGVQESLQFLRGYFPWLMGTGEGYGEWAAGYAFLQTAVVVIPCYFLQIIFEKLFRIKLLLAALLLAGILFCLLDQRAVPHLGMAFGLCYIVTVYAEWAEGHWKKVRSESPRAYMLRIMPFLAVYLLLMSCMPAPQAPLEWKWVKSMYRQVRENFLAYTHRIKWGGREGFDMAFSGFSEEAGLQDNLQEGLQEAVMTIQWPDTAPENVYLTGTVLDTFDGRQWRQTYQGNPEGVFLDAAETLCAVMAYDGQYRKDYIHNIKLKICYQDFNTGYVFAPLKTWELRSAGEGLAYTCEGGSLRMERRQGYGTTYELQYYQVNGGQDEFYRFLEARSRDGSISPGETPFADRAVWEDMSGFELEALAAHRREIYDNYLGEVRLSEEAADYMARITEGAETDVEKLRAIQRELSSFTYTRTPGALPEWVVDEEEFLDYFLLHSRQGYCTYFATAFVLLARAEGIPARYVQGFCVPAQDTKEVRVYSNMAHAWPEVYISGAGWIAFEPTPGYGEIRFTPWELTRPDTAETVEGAGGEDRTDNAVEGEFPGTGTESRPEEEADPEEADEEGQTGHFWRALGYGVPMVLAGYVLLLLLDNAWSRYRYRRMCPEEKLKLEVSRNLRLLALSGVRREECETLQELGDRCSLRTGCGAENNTAGRLRFIENYESVLYGGRSVSREMIEETVEERRMLLELLKQEKRWAYISWRVQSWLIRYR